jgi:AcrR family transcriptional regulator
MTPARIDRRERMAQQTRQDILHTARRLFAERGYVHTSINNIAEEAGVAVQTIYDRLGSKRGMLAGLLELIDEESGVRENAGAIFTANNPTDALRGQIRVTRDLQERCGDIIAALLAAAPVEHELADTVAVGVRRHREGARMTIDRIAQLNGLRDDLPADQAAALLAAATTHEAWRELVQANKLTWDQAEHTLNQALARALLNQPQTPPQ